jgi:hypothetical protein
VSFRAARCETRIEARRTVTCGSSLLSSGGGGGLNEREAGAMLDVTIADGEAPARQEQESQRRVAIHESGHCICANWFDPPIPIISATVEANPRAQVIISRYPRCETRGWDLAMFAQSGPAAEQFMCGQIDDLLDVEMRHYEQAKRYLVADHYPSQNITAALACVRRSADWLVRTGWGQRGIRRVAEALLDRGTLTGAEVRAICGDPRDTRAADWRREAGPAPR